jgi:hypothetical protein
MRILRQCKGKNALASFSQFILDHMFNPKLTIIMTSTPAPRAQHYNQSSQGLPFTHHLRVGQALTEETMQCLLGMLTEHANFGKNSRIIDITQGNTGLSCLAFCDAFVEFSFGIENEEAQWMLSIANLRNAVHDEVNPVANRCYIQHGDILDAKSFDPFTHVFAISLG